MVKVFGIVLILLSSVNAFVPQVALAPFNRWHCIDFVKNIDQNKPYSYNIGDLPLVSWFDKDKAYTTMNICDHMGSKLDNGVVDKGCLYCPYHGISYDENRTFGETMIFEDKLWWSYEPIKTTPPRVPFYHNKHYTTSTITTDIGANVADCIYNTMDINHPSMIHNNIFGFGSNIPPDNIKTIRYPFEKEKIAMSFNYKSTSGLVHLKNSLKKSVNFHMYEYPLTSWSRVSLPRNENLFVNVNLLPLSQDKTRWIITLKHNFWKSSIEREFLKIAAKCIIYQDEMQMKKQSIDSPLKNIIMNQRELPNEDHLNDIKQMVNNYRYPTTGMVVMLYNYHKSLRKN
jgi:hypothetical protein